MTSTYRGNSSDGTNCCNTGDFTGILTLCDGPIPSGFWRPIIPPNSQPHTVCRVKESGPKGALSPQANITAHGYTVHGSPYSSATKWRCQRSQVIKAVARFINHGHTSGVLHSEWWHPKPSSSSQRNSHSSKDAYFPYKSKLHWLCHPACII